MVTNAVVSRDHNIFLGDLEFEGVDPLSLSEFENGVWDNSRVSGEKEYYKNGKKLESSIPTDIVNYLDSNYDYIEAEKQFRELIADVSKPLEYKDDKSKGGSNKKKSFWGKRTRKEERKGSKSIDMGVSAADPNAPPPVVTPPPLNSKKPPICTHFPSLRRPRESKTARNPSLCTTLRFKTSESKRPFRKETGSLPTRSSSTWCLWVFIMRGNTKWEQAKGVRNRRLRSCWTH